MTGFISGADRQQTTLLPECLEDWVDESNPVRAVDVFVEALDLRELGFTSVDPAGTGRPAYHPSPLLNHLIVAHEVTNVGTDKAQLANMASQAKDVFETESLEAVADRGYFKREEILACEQGRITVTRPTSDLCRHQEEGVGRQLQERRTIGPRAIPGA